MIVDDLRSKLVEYHKAGDAQRLGVLRYYLSQVKNKEIELRPSGSALTDEDAFKVLKKLVKQRNEMLEIYQKAGRLEALEKEKAELAVLIEFSKLFPFEL